MKRPRGPYRTPWTCPKCGQTFKQGGYHRPRCGKWEEWYWSKVEKREAAECWLWVGPKDKNGYGRSARKGPNVYPHRVAWRLANGDIPADMEVAHRCDVRNCCNPAHLFLATHEENMYDCKTKGRNTSILTPDAVREIRAAVAPHKGARRLPDGLSKALADKHGVSKHTIYHVISGRNWRHIQ